jgi:hypothetical protein
MLRQHVRALVAVALVAVALSACAKTGQQATTAESSAPQTALTNPTKFPLYQDAKILDVKPFSQTINAGNGTAAAIAGGGAGKYEGHSVISESSASLDDLKKWLAQSESSPPAGFTHVAGAQYPAATAMASKFGITYGIFKAGTGGAVVAVVDPSVTKAKLGFLVGLVDKYQSLPGPLKGQIDDQAKQRTGYSISELMNPSSPIGMTLAALKEVNQGGQRAIVLVDANKQ